jgi:hypothetical protein
MPLTAWLTAPESSCILSFPNVSMFSSDVLWSSVNGRHPLPPQQSFARSRVGKGEGAEDEGGWGQLGI